MNLRNELKMLRTHLATLGFVDTVLFYIDLFWFDIAHRTDTMRSISKKELSLTDDSVQYSPIRTSAFNGIIGQDLQINKQDYTFVDIGCGKGLAMILAANMGFKQVNGIEKSPKLAAICKRNLLLCNVDGQVFQNDATEMVYSFHKERPTVYYMFNPFGEQTLKTVIDKLTYTKTKYHHYVIYINSLHYHILDEKGYKLIFKGNEKPSPTRYRRERIYLWEPQ